MIFLSYCWDDSSYADYIEKYLLEKNFNVLRDKNELKKMDYISDFMDKIETSDYVILLISEAYLKSYNCLYEALGAYKRTDKQNLIPILLSNFHIFDPNMQSSLIYFWVEKGAELSEKSTNIDSISKIEITKRLRQIEHITNYLGDFMAFISNMNCIVISKLGESLEEIYVCICNKILSREVRPNKVIPNRCIDLPNKNILCIDFGTSYTLASIVDIYGTKHLIPNSEGKVIVQSTVEIQENGIYQVGTCSSNVIKNIKRLIGVKEYIKYGEKKIDVKILVAMILKSVVRNAEEYLNIKIEEVLMVIPTDFTLSQKRSLNESVSLIGMNMLRLIPETSAEAFLLPTTSYNPYDLNCVAVIDMGGGTLDISLVEASDEVYEILYVDGDSNLGSIDYEDKIAHFLADKVCKVLSYQKENLYEQMLRYSEHVKYKLNIEESVNVSCEVYNINGDINIIPLTITRKDFESITDNLSQTFKEKLVQLKSKYLEFSKVTKSGPKLPIIYLTGQGTKLYILKKLIKEVFPESHIVDEFQENALISGLSIQNRCLVAFNKQIQYDQIRVLLNLTYFSLILKCHGYNKKENVVSISPIGNSQDLILINHETIPTKKEVALEFISSDNDNTPHSYQLQIFEKKSSGKINPLKCIEVEPQKGTTYGLTVDIDANLNITINLYSGGEAMVLEKKTIQAYLF